VKCGLNSQGSTTLGIIVLSTSVLRAIVNGSRACPPSVGRVYPPPFLPAVFMAGWRIYPPPFWRAVLSKSGCWERNTHQSLSVTPVESYGLVRETIPTLIRPTKSRGKALHFVPRVTLGNFCTSVPHHFQAHRFVEESADYYTTFVYMVILSCHPFQALQL
jgi:hypothetical protein